jgi:hypothetical protein
MKEAMDRCQERVRALAEELDETGRAHELIWSLYVTLERLHRSLKVADVVAAIAEVIINLVGSEDFALFVLDDASRTLQPLSSMGAGATLRAFAAGDGAFGQAASAGRPTFGDPPALAPLADDGGRVVGLIAIVGLLSHRPALERREQVIVEALAAHAGVALEAALAAVAGPPAWDASRLRALAGNGGA